LTTYTLVLTLALFVFAAAANARVPAHGSTVAQAKKEIRRLWGPQAPRAFCIVGRESSWNPRAVSRTNDHGLFQLNAIHARTYGRVWWARRYDPVANVRMAWRLYRGAGWSPWAGGAYRC
jgi:membrane-bound lytic murein transglycosylase MltF